MENGVTRSEDTGTLRFKVRPQRMAGEMGARAIHTNE